MLVYVSFISPLTSLKKSSLLFVLSQSPSQQIEWFGTFVTNRVAEIQSKTPKSEWYWIPSDHNPADFTTKITPPSFFNNDSVWQKGPEFLYEPFETWPIKDNVEVKEIRDAWIQNAQIKMTV